MLDKFKGCLIGLACGDYLGSPVEFSLRSEQVREFFEGDKLKPVPDMGSSNPRRIPGFYTDDTAMAICLAESLIEKGFDIKDQFRRYYKWLMEGYATPFGDQAFDPGQHTFRVLTTQTENNIPLNLEHREDQGGNGALMRCAPVGLRFYRDPDLKDYSIRSAIVTHNNREAAWACVVLNQFIAYALVGEKNKEEYCSAFLERYPDCPPKIREVLKLDFVGLDKTELDHSGYVIHTLTIALQAFFTTDDFEAAVTTAIYRAGDTDTQGAVTGALAGAYYGYGAIPAKWRDKLIRRDYIEKLAENIYKSIVSE